MIRTPAEIWEIVEENTSKREYEQIRCNVDGLFINDGFFFIYSINGDALFIQYIWGDKKDAVKRACADAFEVCRYFKLKAIEYETDDPAKDRLYKMHLKGCETKAVIGRYELPEKRMIN